MGTLILNPFTQRLHALREGATGPLPIDTLVHALLSDQYCPEELSYTENQTFWADLVYLALMSGLTEADFKLVLKASEIDLLQWKNGVSMPKPSQVRKGYFHCIIHMLVARQEALE